MKITNWLSRLRKPFAQKLSVKKYSAYRELRKHGISVFNSLVITLCPAVVGVFATGGKSVITNWKDARMLHAIGPQMASWVQNIGARNAGAAFYDIGANIGQCAILAAKAGMRVYAFEPHPDSFRTLFQNIRLNRIAITPINCLVSDKNGILAFDIGTKWSGSCAFDNRTSRKKIVSTLSTTLNSFHTFFGLPRPEYLKIDTDGYELQIIENSDMSSVRELSIEISDEKKHGEVQRILISKGFVRFDEEYLLKDKKYPMNEFWKRK